jgi:hypothetical protein
VSPIVLLVEEVLHIVNKCHIGLYRTILSVQIDLLCSYSSFIDNIVGLDKSYGLGSIFRFLLDKGAIGHHYVTK